MAEVKIDRVVKKYGSLEVMHGVSADIQDGEFVVLVGPSGCGKSTLLRMIAGLEAITASEISIGGRIVNNVAPKDRDIAMVFQSYALYPHKSVAENIGFPLKMAKLPKAEIAVRVRSAAEILDVVHLLDRFPKQLSGGQRQRVAMGRAIVRNPRVFLFDEPLSNLDAKLRVAMRVEIKELHQRLQTTVIYVTHDQIEAMTMADRIVVMRDGNIEQVGTPLDLYDYPANMFVAGFIGSPAMNFVEGQVSMKDGTAEFVSRRGATLPMPAGAFTDGQAVIYGIRPEHIEIGEGGFPVRVSVLEPTGSETHVFAHAGNDPLDAVVRARISAKPGETVPYLINPANVHLFDSKTKKRI